MRVMYVTGSFPPMMCGIGDYTKQLSNTLVADYGVQVGILTSQGARSAESQSGVQVLPIGERWTWGELAAIVRSIRAWKPDVVHFQFLATGHGSKLLPWVLPLCVSVMGFRVAQTWHFIPGAAVILRFFPLRFLCAAVTPGLLFVLNEQYRAEAPAWLRILLRNKTVGLTRVESTIPVIKISSADKERYRAKYVRQGMHMIVYFGFLHPGKGIEHLFEIADAEEDHLLIVGGTFRGTNLDIFPKSFRPKAIAYAQSIEQLAQSERWKGKVTLTGFLPPDEAACLIASADAVVLPFDSGSDPANSSLRSAQAQGTFVLTTSTRLSGYYPEMNTYFAIPKDIESMREALKRYMGVRSEGVDESQQSWRIVAREHMDLYVGSERPSRKDAEQLIS